MNSMIEHLCNINKVRVRRWFQGESIVVLPFLEVWILEYINILKKFFYTFLDTHKEHNQENGSGREADTLGVVCDLADR